MTPLLSLASLLPLLAFVNAGNSHTHRARGHLHSIRDHLVYIERSAPAAPPAIALEARLAKRAHGKILANRAANSTQCRARGSTYVAAVPIVSTTSTTSTTSSASAAPSTTSATPTTSNTPTSSATPGSSGGSATSNVAYGSFTPNGIKAGIAGGDAYPFLQNHLGWWYDWTPDPSGYSGTPIAVPMLWGDGQTSSTDAARLAAFEALNWNPPYIIGFEEPDCPAGSGSAGFDVSTGVQLWDQWMVPHGQGGSLLISPSMCMQASESGWLQPFQQQITRNWDITNVHINKNSAAGIELDLDHYWNTYGKPMWVTEFACVDDSNGFVPCEDQDEINSFIWTAVQIFESDSRVAGYAYSNGYGLGNNWPLMNGNSLSASGQTYLAAISQYH